MILGSYFASSQIIGSGLRCFMTNLNSPKVEKEMFPQRFSLQTIDGKQYISLVAKVYSDATNEEIEKENGTCIEVKEAVWGYDKDGNYIQSLK